MNGSAMRPEQPGSSRRILDIGCGNVKISGAVGLDISPDTQADVVHDLNIFPWPFPDQEFDFINCPDVIEHLDEIARVLEELHRLTKPGAVIRIRVPHFTSVHAFTDVTHKHFFSTQSFDYWSPTASLYPHYSRARFSIEAPPTCTLEALPLPRHRLPGEPIQAPLREDVRLHLCSRGNRIQAQDAAVFRISRSSRRVLFSRRSRRSSSRSSVVSPSVRCLASRSAWASQLRMVWADGANRRLRPLPEDQVALPVAWHGSVLDVGWSFADQHHVLQRARGSGATEWATLRAPRPQAPRELLAQRPAPCTKSD